MTKSDEQLARGVRVCERTGISIDIAYDTFGASSNPPLILIMGLGGQMVLWDVAFCEELARTFYVIRFDNRDIGLSTKMEGIATPWMVSHILPWWVQVTKTPEPYTLEDMALDTWALVDRLLGKDAKVHLVGASMGGMIAQCATIQYPERVMSLTSIMSTTGAQDLPPPDLKTQLHLGFKRPKSMSVEDRLAFRTDLIEQVLAYGVPYDKDAARRTTEETLQRSLYIDGLHRQIAAVVRTKNREEALRALGDRMPPTLVIHGLQDKLVPAPHGVRTAAVIPAARLLLVDGMGHFMTDDRVRSIVTSAIVSPSTAPLFKDVEAAGTKLPQAPRGWLSKLLFWRR